MGEEKKNETSNICFVMRCDGRLNSESIFYILQSWKVVCLMGDGIISHSQRLILFSHTAIQ